MKKWVMLVVIFFWTFAGNIEAQEENPTDSKVVYVISLQGEIFERLTQEVIKKLSKVNLSKAKAIIIEIDTPGGVVPYVFDICQKINQIQKEVPVYAFILHKALSGGALVALACDDIYMTDIGMIGDAQVKIMTPTGMQNADEKLVSPVRTKFREYAEKRQRSKAIAESMVDPEVEVKKVEYKGTPYYLTQEEIKKMQIEEKKKNPFFRDQDIHIGETIVEVGKLATFTAKEAQTYGYCKKICDNRKELLNSLELQKYPIEEVNLTLKDTMANLLTNSWVRFFLIMLGILGILLEFLMPGTGIPGILGIVFLSLFFLGGYLAQVTELWEIILFVLGVFLLMIELFFIPGFGIVGILGIICCFLAILLSLQDFTIPRTDEQMHIFMRNIFIAFSGVGVDVFFIFFLSKFLPESAPLQRLSVSTVQREEDGYTTAIPELEKLKGKKGIAASPLRPSGRIQIEDQFYDAVTQGEFLNNGEKIQVLEVQGNRIIVEKERISP